MTQLFKFKCCSQKPKNFPATLIWGERDFFIEKQIFYFISTVFVEDCMLLIFFEKKHPQLLHGIEMHVRVLYALNSINSKL